MKTKAITLVCAAALISAGTTASAEDSATASPAGEKKPGFAVRAADAVLVRPVSLVSTAADGVVFVLSLPVRADRNRTAGRAEPGLESFRWLLEELQVSLFAQELRTPFPVSFKRVEKAWADLGR